MSSSKAGLMGPPLDPKKKKMSETSSNSDFSQAAKLKCREYTDDECWICHCTPVQVAHVVAKEDRAKKYLVKQGLINFPLKSNVNGVALCGNCHVNFDLTMDPGWFFVPNDLQYFIDFEEKDFAERTATMRRGIFTERLCPTPAEYALSQPGGQPLYQRIVLADNTIAHERMTPTAKWDGAPMAAIRRAFIALGSVRRSVIPKDVAERLWTLQDLYARVPGFEIQPSAMPADFADVPRPLKRPADEEDEEIIPKISPKRPRAGFPIEDTLEVESPHRRSSRRLSISETEDEYWALGPGSTSNSAIERFRPLFRKD